MKLKYLILFALSLLGSAFAQTGCNSPEARQFDFWLGEWEVHQPDGKVVGKDVISKTLEGCVLEERWAGIDGNQGVSINAYSEPEKKWVQTYMDNAGTVLVIWGEFKEGKMILQGSQPGRRAGLTIINRITWFIQAADRVRQLWEISRDEGKTWEAVSDGIFIRK